MSTSSNENNSESDTRTNNRFQHIWMTNGQGAGGGVRLSSRREGRTLAHTETEQWVASPHSSGDATTLISSSPNICSGVWAQLIDTLKKLFQDNTIYFTF